MSATLPANPVQFPRKARGEVAITHGLEARENHAQVGVFKLGNCGRWTVTFGGRLKIGGRVALGFAGLSSLHAFLQALISRSLEFDFCHQVKCHENIQWPGHHICIFFMSTRFFAIKVNTTMLSPAIYSE